MGNEDIAGGNVGSWVGIRHGDRLAGVVPALTAPHTGVDPGVSVPVV